MSSSLHCCVRISVCVDSRSSNQLIGAFFFLAFLSQSAVVEAAVADLRAALAAAKAAQARERNTLGVDLSDWHRARS